MNDEERMELLDRVYVPAGRVLEGAGLQVDAIQDVTFTADTDWIDDRKVYTVVIKARCKR